MEVGATVGAQSIDIVQDRFETLEERCSCVSDRVKQPSTETGAAAAAQRPVGGDVTTDGGGVQVDGVLTLWPLLVLVGI